MNVFATLAKHGVAVLVGFLLGLAAIAVIAPHSANGKLLLLLTVVIATTILAQLGRLLLRWLRPAVKPADAPDTKQEKPD